ncbi:MAG TPA: tRNA lysidine(34) synthetase TilS [Pseudolabrys sp.]|nr:tRNA lysidine(34) synthetase TilS [Pseudolabrys sp.]
MSTAEAKSVSRAEAAAIFSDLRALPVLILAVSGGPDSTALMFLAARWRDGLKVKPRLLAVTVDHGLRKESKSEAAAVARLARKYRIAHRTLRWMGPKPLTGVQEAARIGRYALLEEAARQAGASHILTGHTLDDQAETVLLRMSRGSGLAGLGGMKRVSVIPRREAVRQNFGSQALQKPLSRSDPPRQCAGKPQICLVRPLLEIPKTRLIMTLQQAKIPYAEDSSNRSMAFARVRMRDLMKALAGEGLDAAQLARLARRLRRADCAIEATVDRTWDELVVELPGPLSLAMEARRFVGLPAEIALRLLGRALDHVGDEGPVELGKLEMLHLALLAACQGGQHRFRRTLAGGMVTLADPQIIIERAFPRRGKLLTK